MVILMRLKILIEMISGHGHLTRRVFRIKYNDHVHGISTSDTICITVYYY
jgi:hypothetical protein